MTGVIKEGIAIMICGTFVIICSGYHRGTDFSGRFNVRRA
jgi:hypothetical protein